MPESLHEPQPVTRAGHPVCVFGGAHRMESLVKALFETLARHNIELFAIGDSHITLGGLLLFLLALLALSLLSRVLQNWVISRLLRHSHLERAMQQTIATLLHYAVLVIGFTVIMQNAGLDLSAFGILAGAFGVGVGFGLQNIFSNVISGVIIMIERPVRIGDRIEIGGHEGDVLAIRARSTLLRTNRGALVIVPNQKFITEYVRNWESADGLTSLQVIVRIAPGADPGGARERIAAAVGGHPDIAAEPAPRVYLTAADATGFSFDAQVWLAGDPVRRAEILGELLATVAGRLTGAGIKLA